MAGRRSPVRYAIKRDQIYRSIEREHAREAEAIAKRAKALLQPAVVDRDREEGAAAQT